jgi:hypothetical protein
MRFNEKVGVLLRDPKKAIQFCQGMPLFLEVLNYMDSIGFQPDDISEFMRRPPRSCIVSDGCNIYTKDFTLGRGKTLAMNVCLGGARRNGIQRQAPSPWLVQNDSLCDDHPHLGFKPALVCTSASFPGVALWKSDRKFGTNVSGSLRMLVTLNWRWNSPWLQRPELATEEARS